MPQPKQSSPEPSPNVTGIMISSSSIALPKARISEVRVAPKRINYETVPALPIKQLSTITPKTARSTRVAVVSSPAESFQTAMAFVPLDRDPNETPNDQTSKAYSVPSDELTPTKADNSDDEQNHAKSSEQPIKSDQEAVVGSLLAQPPATVKSKGSQPSSSIFETPISSDIPTPPSSPNSIVYQLPKEWIGIAIQTPSSPQQVVVSAFHETQLPRKQSPATNQITSSNAEAANVSSPCPSIRTDKKSTNTPPLPQQVVAKADKKSPVSDKMTPSMPTSKSESASDEPSALASNKVPIDTESVKKEGFPTSVNVYDSMPANSANTVSLTKPTDQVATKVVSPENWTTPTSGKSNAKDEKESNDVKDKDSPAKKDTVNADSNIKKEPGHQVMVISPDIKQATPQTQPRPLETAVPIKEELTVKKPSQDLPKVIPDPKVAQLSDDEMNFLLGEVNKKPATPVVPSFAESGVKPTKPVDGPNASKLSQEAQLEPPKQGTEQLPQAPNQMSPVIKMEDPVLVQSSMAKLAPTLEPVAAPFENTRPQPFEESQVPHNKSTADLQRGLVASARPNHLLESSGIPEVDELLLKFKPGGISEAEEQPPMPRDGDIEDKPNSVKTPTSTKKTLLSGAGNVPVKMDSPTKKDIITKPNIDKKVDEKPDHSSKPNAEQLQEPGQNTEPKKTDVAADVSINENLDQDITFYHFQEQFFGKMRKFQPSSVSDPDSIAEGETASRRPIKSRMELEACQQNLMRRQDEFVKRVSNFIAGRNALISSQYAAAKDGRPNLVNNASQQDTPQTGPHEATGGNLLFVLAILAAVLAALIAAKLF